MNYTYTIKVINRESGKSVKELEVIGFNKAHKVKSGMEINMGDKYYATLIKND